MPARLKGCLTQIFTFRWIYEYFVLRQKIQTLDPFSQVLYENNRTKLNLILANNF